MIGYDGCAVLGGEVWNLGYRLAADQQGHGHAVELARESIRRAHLVNSDWPVVAYLMEHNLASERVARRIGLTLAHRGKDVGNPDPTGVRLVYADRALTPQQLAASTR